MTDIYLHGIETIERNNGPRSVSTIDTGIIGLVGTAPSADTDLWPLDTPIPIHGYGGFPGGLGNSGTLKDAIEGIFKQATRASQTIVVVRVTEGATPVATRANILGSITARTGVHALRRSKSLHNLKPKLLCAPGFTGVRPGDGIASITRVIAGSGYDPANPPAVTIARGAGDTTGYGATAVAIVSPSGTIEEIVLKTQGEGYSVNPTVTIAAPTSGTTATATATRGFVASPVTAELLTVANALRATVVVEAPATTASDAVQYRLDFDTDRLLIVEPNARVAAGEAIVSRPASAMVCGMQAKIDYEEGFWVSPSNHVIEGVLGSSRTIEHSTSDPSAESQYLNKNAVACIVRSPSGGWKLWGSRVPSSDSLKAFWSVRRAHDTIIESIELAHEPFVDKPFSKQNLIDIGETVNSALRRWKALGATLGGRVWLDPSLNTAQSMAGGLIYVSYDAEGPAPMEHIVFEFNRNTGYYTELLEGAAREIARLATL